MSTCICIGVDWFYAWIGLIWHRIIRKADCWDCWAVKTLLTVSSIFTRKEFMPKKYVWLGWSNCRPIHWILSEIQRNRCEESFIELVFAWEDLSKLPEKFVRSLKHWRMIFWSFMDLRGDFHGVFVDFKVCTYGKKMSFMLYLMSVSNKRRRSILIIRFWFQFMDIPS